MERYPINLNEYEELAKKILPHNIWDYIEAGRGDEISLKRNTEIYDEVFLRPNKMVDIAEIKMSTTILGDKTSFPLMIAPAGGHTFCDEDGELSTIRAAKKENIIAGVGTNSSYTIEDISKETDTPLWFQIYHLTKEIDEMLVKRAEKSGYKVIALTVDGPVPGMDNLRPKERDIRNAFVTPPNTERVNLIGEIAGLGYKQGDPEVLLGGLNPVNQLLWEDITWFKSLTDLPIVIKGLQSAHDAKKAIEYGADGIVVSNHGARGVDTLMPSLQSLPEVVKAADGKCEVYLDGGIRRGTDILKALAFGAKAVMIGRPFYWGLAVGGENGVRDVIQILKEELEVAMKYCGITDVENIDPDLLSYNFS